MRCFWLVDTDGVRSLAPTVTPDELRCRNDDFHTAAGLFLTAVGRYQRHLSPRLRVTCRYVPSCSAYAAGAVQRHGLQRGCVLAARRLRRCLPDVPPATPDPVPGRGRP